MFLIALFAFEIHTYKADKCDSLMVEITTKFNKKLNSALPTRRYLLSRIKSICNNKEHLNGLNVDWSLMSRNLEFKAH